MVHMMNAARASRQTKDKKTSSKTSRSELAPAQEVPKSLQMKAQSSENDPVLEGKLKQVCVCVRP